MMQDNIVKLENALLVDLGRHRQETTLGDIGPVIKACLVALEHLEEWARPTKPVVKDPSRSAWDPTVFPTPKGVALFIT